LGEEIFRQEMPQNLGPSVHCFPLAPWRIISHRCFSISLALMIPGESA